jgi:uncharacterized repeat protein (TIGR03943 family)
MSSGRVLLGLIGITLIRLSTTGQYKHYVRVASGRWLLLAGVALIVLIIADLLLERAPRRRPDDDSQVHDHEHDHDHGHDHSRIPQLSWLLLVPIAIAFVVAPPALGQWGLDASSNRNSVSSRKANFRPLPRNSRPRPMATNEFVARAYDGNGGSLDGVVVVIEAFVVQPNPTSLTIARYSIACCAADALASQVRVRLSPDLMNDLALTRDSWVRVSGRFVGLDEKELPIIEADGVVTIPAPANTYEG